MKKYLLVGNPNVGKTTFFNTMTGANARVGNYSGITVDKLEGQLKQNLGTLIDLPGTYSVTPSSEDEGVVTYALLKEPFDEILNIVDATHLKRNLQLSIQLLETGYDMSIVMNMMDVLSKSGLTLNKEKMSEMLGVNLHFVSAKSSNDVSSIYETLGAQTLINEFKLDYGPVIEATIERIESLISSAPSKVSKRWIAIQLLEGNTGIFKHIQLENKAAISQLVSELETEIVEREIALSLKGAIFNVRREFIATVYDTCVTQTASATPTLNRVDKILTHPVIGLFIFAGIMYFIYMLTFDWFGNLISDGLDGFLNDSFIPMLQNGLVMLGAGEESFIHQALIDGIVAGVGGVIIFLPQIVILFFLLSMLEATGYMARVAMIMDQIFSRFGLDGKAIVPLITGFGCNVPAIMATRTIPNRWERIKMMTIIPFMSCAARLPIYVLFVGLFFKENQALIIMVLYFIGILTALLSSKLLSVSVFKKANTDFVLEIPPYRMPQFSNIGRQTLDRAKAFLLTAGKFILIGSFVLWFLNATGPNGFGVESEDSFLAMIGGLIAPLFAPLGFGTWQAGSSLIVGFLAKEVVASSMLIVTGGEAGLLTLFTPLQAFSFLIFTLLYIPCLATVGVMYQETKSSKMTGYMIAFGLVVAYVITFVVYQVGNLFFV